jgi:hypothetical protein
MAGKVVQYEGYATHQQALVKYVSMASEGDLIVELGCGYYSTPLIDSIALIRGLKFKCYYQEINWQKQIEPLCPNTEFIHVPNWNVWRLEEECHLSMLDNEELCVNRYKQIDRSLFKQSKFILMHDADIYPKRGIPIQDEFELDYYDKQIPHTAVIDTSKPKKIKKKESVSVAKNPEPDFSKELEPKKKLKLSEDIKTAVVCCFTAGGDYDQHYLEYIQRLADGVEANNTKGVKLHCVTIMNLDDIPNVTRIHPVKENWKGWHIKAEIFRSEVWKGYDRVLYIDLDTVITGSIDEMLSSTEEFSLLHDFYQPRNQETGMIYFNPERTQSLYEKFNKRQPAKQIKDADIINQWMKVNKIKPTIMQNDFKIGSYKVSLIRDQKKADDYDIICFHGIPRPHHVGWSLDINNTVKMSKNASKSLLKQAEKNKVEPVERIWEGQDVFVIGGGPSLTGLDLDEYLMDKNVLGINDGYLLKSCDVCYFGDTVWWKHHNEGIKEFDGPIYTTSGVVDPTLNHLDTLGVGFSDEPNRLAWNSNSGMAGINLAALLGAKSIFLLGFDMNFGEDGESNWHKNIRTVSRNSYKVFLGKERVMAQGIKSKFPELEIFNVEANGVESKMTSFTKVQFDELFIRKE